MDALTFQFSAYDLPYEDETDEILQKDFLKKDILHLQNIAEQLGLPCLRWISVVSMTFFNDKQTYEIKIRELPILKKDPTVNKDILEHIEKIIHAMNQEGHCFMKIEPKFN